MVSVDEQIKIIANGAEEIISVDDLKRKLERSQKTGVRRAADSKART